MELISSVLFGVCLLCYFLLLKELYDRRKICFITGAKYPGEYIYPILGNLPAVAALSPEKSFTFLRKFAKKYNASYRFWFIGMLVINTIRAAEVEIILSSSKHTNKSLIYDFLRPFMGTGLLTSSGKKWQQRRKILTPAFHFNILKEFFGIFKEETAVLLDVLNSEAKSKRITNVTPLMARFTLNTICETAMGVQLKTLSKPDEYRENIHKIGVKLIHRLMRPWLYSDFVYKLLGYRNKFEKITGAAHNFTEKIINQKRASFQQRQKEYEPLLLGENIYETKKRRYAMLDTLLSAEANNEIDQSGIREEVDTFMFEGHDTTSSGLTFSLLLIATHNDVQEKLHEEIQNTLGDRDISDLQVADFVNMKLLDRVMKECLRIYPSVSFISRELSEDWLTDKGVIPCGSMVHVHIYDLHRDPEQFPDPEKFQPDRFLPENIEKRHPFAYIPFSAGPRNCIGQKFAMLEMKTVIVNVLCKYQLSAITKREDIVFVADLVLRTKTPILIKFELR